jgi:hypothetical protein
LCYAIKTEKGEWNNRKVLQLLLEEVLGLVCGLVIDVNVGTLDIRQRLELHLQLLGNVMGSAEGIGGIHDDVDLDEEARAGGIGADGVDGGN